MPARRSLVPLALFLSIAAVGCSGAAVEDAQAGADAITDAPQSSVKRQIVGNCWLYTTAAWAEGLVLATDPAKPAPDYSESYWTYWQWFDQITSEAWYTSLTFGYLGVNDLDAISEGNSFHRGLAIIEARGLVLESTFRTGNPETALRYINTALRTTLSSSSARRDHALVRRELDMAWSLTPAVIADLDAVFTPAGDRTVAEADEVASQRTVLRAEDIVVRVREPGAAAPVETRLADLAYGDRAWRAVAYPKEPSERRAVQVRVQRALHDGYSLPISWWSKGASAEGYEKGVLLREEGPHLSLLTDYEIDQVPGFGLLPLDAPEARPEALAAALDPAAVITRLRFKNSWGVAGTSGSRPGYVDLGKDYFDGAVFDPPVKGKSRSLTALGAFILPAGY